MGCKGSKLAAKDCPAGVKCKPKPAKLNSDWTHCYRDECAKKVYSNDGRDGAIGAECKIKGATYDEKRWHDCGDFHFSGRCVFPKEEEKELDEEDFIEEPSNTEKEPNDSVVTTSDSTNTNLPPTNNPSLTNSNSEIDTKTIIIGVLVIALIFMFMQSKN